MKKDDFEKFDNSSYIIESYEIQFFKFGNGSMKYYYRNKELTLEQLKELLEITNDGND